MTAIVTTEHVETFQRCGYALVRRLLPASLLRDLRRACDRGRELVRTEKGPQAQRFQPINAYDVDPRPFMAYRDLPELRELITGVLSSRHTTGDLQSKLGVLVDPHQKPYTIKWHRDWGHVRVQGLHAAWADIRQDLDYFNQINCALYRDASLWIVPASHHRDDRAEELAAAESLPGMDGLDAEEAELAGLDYCRSMPGAECVHLDPGDLLLYRNTMWHTGTYTPDHKRATLHDIVDTPRYQAFRSSFQELQQVHQVRDASASTGMPKN